MIGILSVCYKGGNEQRQAGYWIGFEYSVQIVQALKAAVPHTQREWHEDKKLWWVSIEYEDELDRLFKNFDALARKQASFW